MKEISRRHHSENLCMTFLNENRIKREQPSLYSTNTRKWNRNFFSLACIFLLLVQKILWSKHLSSILHITHDQKHNKVTQEELGTETGWDFAVSLAKPNTESSCNVTASILPCLSETSYFFLILSACIAYFVTRLYPAYFSHEKLLCTFFPQLWTPIQLRD